MEIRIATPKDAEEISKVHVESWKATYRNIIDDSYLDGLKWEDRVARWQQQLEPKEDEIVLVAIVHDKVVGFISGGKNRTAPSSFDGELYAIYLFPAFQRQGIGEQLFVSFTDWAKKRFHSIIVWVARLSPYQNFYLKMEGKQTPFTETHKVADREITMIAYSWRL